MIIVHSGAGLDRCDRKDKMMAMEVDVHRVWAKGTPVERGVLRFAHYEIAGVKYVDVHLYGVAGDRTWRATMRLKDSEIDDFVMALIRGISGTRLLDLGKANLELFQQKDDA
jgi:hypothetical protein